MIIHDLNIVCIAVAPHKANAPLVIDAYAVLSLSIALERFQVITRRCRQVAQLCSDIQLPKFSLRHALETPKPFDALSRMELFRLLRPEGLNHTINSITLSVKRQACYEDPDLRREGALANCHADARRGTCPTPHLGETRAGPEGTIVSVFRYQSVITNQGTSVRARALAIRNLARPEGFEPPTYGFVVRRSIR